MHVSVPLSVNGGTFSLLHVVSWLYACATCMSTCTIAHKGKYDANYTCQAQWMQYCAFCGWHPALLSLGNDGLHYVLCGINDPNQQLLESKQPVNLGWPRQLPPVIGNTVIWARGPALGSAHWAEPLWHVCVILQGHLVGTAEGQANWHGLSWEGL